MQKRPCVVEEGQSREDREEAGEDPKQEVVLAGTRMAAVVDMAVFWVNSEVRLMGIANRLGVQCE